MKQNLPVTLWGETGSLQLSTKSSHLSVRHFNACRMSSPEVWSLGSRS